MTNNKHLLTLILLYSLVHGNIQYAKSAEFSDDSENVTISEQKFNTTDKEKSRRKKASKTISFHYENEDLIDVINFIASKKNINIVLPQGASAITNKVTMHLDKKVSLNEAWKILNTLLDIAGYTLEPKGDMYMIVKNNPNISREPLPLFIGMEPDSLPDSDQRIRYIYYFNNLRVSDDPSAELNTILQNYLPAATSSFKVDPNSNAVIISAKSNDIRSIMKIILELDKIDFQEVIEVINIRHTTSKFIADLFNENILKAAQDFNRYRLDARQQTEASFFSKYVKIFSEDRTNSLIVLGRPQAVERVKDFIFKYLDVELDSGKSILHVYQLQYLDAQSMEGILNRIVQSAQQGGTDQARISGGATVGGIQRTFEDVKIKADTPLSADNRYSGGNKLVIAARQDDWKVLEKLIEQLDVPQPQVLIEVLIADLSLEDSRIIGSLLRNPAGSPLMGQTNFQAANIGQIIPDSTSGTVSTLQDNLLGQVFAPQSGSTGPNFSIATTLADTNPGSSFLSLNDKNGSTYGILQILQANTNSKIISNPHLIVTNNFKAVISIGETRLLTDETVASGGTTSTVKQRKESANLTVTITPRINSANAVQLNVVVDITNFIPDTTSLQNARTVRQVATNALVKNKDILALGGLVEIDSTDFLSETPILSKIPIIGYFFKNRNSDVAKTNLTVFITPTIIEPRLRNGVDQYTKQYINLTKSYALEGGLFDSLKDPITRWFFSSEFDADTALDEFVAKDEFKNKDINPDQVSVDPLVVNKKDRRGRRRRTNTRLANLTPQEASLKQKTRAHERKELQEKIATLPTEVNGFTGIKNQPASNFSVLNQPTKMLNPSEVKTVAPSSHVVQANPVNQPITQSAPTTTQASFDKAQQLQKLIENDNPLLNVAVKT